jgi:hypothetical protein
MIQVGFSVDFRPLEVERDIIIIVAFRNILVCVKNTLRWPGIEPGSTAWKAAMLTIIPPTLLMQM